MKNLLILIAAAHLGCATIVKPERQMVDFRGGSPTDTIRVSLPDNDLIINNGEGSKFVTRSRQDIPVTITCNGKTTNTVLPTRFDPLAGGVGNAALILAPMGLLLAPLGLGLDAFGNKAYDVQSPYNVGPYCQSSQPQ